MVETINKLIRVSRQLLQELGREPTPEEIAAEMNMPVERVRERHRLVRRRTAILEILSRMIMYLFRQMPLHLRY